MCLTVSRCVWERIAVTLAEMNRCIDLCSHRLSTIDLSAIIAVILKSCYSLFCVYPTSGDSRNSHTEMITPRGFLFQLYGSA